MKNFTLLVFITLAACFTPIFAKLTVAEISPVSLGFLRFGVAAVLFYFTLKIRIGNLDFERKDYPRLFLLGILCIPLNQFFFLTGVKMSYASHSGIIYSLNPIFAYLVAITGKTEKFYPSKLSAILLTIAGIFFVFYEGFTQSGFGSQVLVGDVLLVGAVLTFSLYLSLGKELINKYGALKANTFVFLIGSICYLPMFIYDMHNLNFSLLTYKGIFGYLYLTVLVAYLTYLIWYYALKSIAISKLTTMGNLSPLLTVLFSIIFLSEHISVYFVIGGILTILGVFIMHRVSIDLR